MRYAIAVVIGICASIWWLNAWSQSNFSDGGFFGDIKAGGYNGPGDVVSGAKGYWGTRCYNKTFSGPIAEIWDSGGSTSNTTMFCSTGGVTSFSTSTGCTAGGAACAPLSTTCSGACVIAELYDQSGANACGGSPCHATQPTNSSRPLFSQNVLGTKPCASSAGGTPELDIPSTLTVVQPLTIIVTTERVTVNGQYQGLLTTGAGTAGVYFAAAAGTLYASFGTSQTPAITDNAFHAIQVVGNDPSGSIIAFDGGSTSFTLGTNSFGGAVSRYGSDSFGGRSLAGYLCEAGVWGTAFSGPNITSMNSNQHSYWGF